MQFEHVFHHIDGGEVVCFCTYTIEAKHPRLVFEYSTDLQMDVERPVIDYTAKMVCDGHGSSALSKSVVAVREDAVDTSDGAYFAAKMGEMFMMCPLNLEEICRFQVSLGRNIERVLEWRDLNRPDPWDLPKFPGDC